MMNIGNKRGLMMWLVALITLFAAGVASAGMQLDIENELRLLRNGQAQKHIGMARYRFAVFTFEDPDGTGLGNAVASILSHDLLMNSKVNSIGVLRYVGDLSKASDNRQLRYFDKVEPLIETQEVQLAIWGTIRRIGDRLRIDSFTQLSPSVMDTAFSYSFHLPQMMGSGRLVHRVGPDRMLIQRLELSAEEADNLTAIAINLDRFRAAPDDAQPFTGRLPLGSVYYVQHRQDEWARIGMKSGKSGWLRTTGFCTGACAPLMAVSRFASELMAYDDLGKMPAYSEWLAPDAKAFTDQLMAVAAINGGSEQYAEFDALNKLKPWCPAKGDVTGDRPPPGGAAICNLRAIIRLVGFGRMAAWQPREGLPTDIVVRSVADELATTSMSDPRHVPTLKNLATLFSFLGDTERSKLAAKLAEDAVSVGHVTPSAGQP